MLTKGRLNTDFSPRNFWTTFLENDLTGKLKKSALANAIAILLPLCFSCFVLLRRFRENLTKPFYFYLSRTCGSLGGTPSVISLALSMWNTMECKRDCFSGALGGARETYWERVSWDAWRHDRLSGIYTATCERLRCWQQWRLRSRSRRTRRTVKVCGSPRCCFSSHQ